MKTISLDLRQRIVEAYDAAEGNPQEIADRFKVSVQMVKKLLAQRKKNGHHRATEPQVQTQAEAGPTGLSLDEENHQQASR